MKSRTALIAVLCLLLPLAARAKPGDPPPTVQSLQAPEVIAPPTPESLHMLILVLESDNDPAAERAAWCLGDSGLKDAVPPLVKVLASNRSPLLRAQCARSLGVLKSVESGPALLTALSDESPAVRQWAAWAAGEIREKRAAARLGELAADASVQPVARQAAAALGKIAAPESAAVLSGLTKRPEPFLRLAAIRALGSFGAQKAEVAPVLIGFLTSKSQGERAAAAQALGEIKAESAASGLTELLKDPNPTVRRVAVAALAAAAGKAAETALAGATKDADPTVRKEAAVELGRLALTGQDKALFDLFADPHFYVRDAALDSFVSFKTPGVIALAGEGLTSKTDLTREYSSRALGILKSAEKLDDHIRLLADPWLPARRSAAGALGGIGEQKACAPLLEAVQVKGQDAMTCANAIHSLGMMLYAPTAPVIRPLVPQKRAVDYTIREAACWTLGMLKDQASVPILLGRLNDRDLQEPEGLTIRFEAVIALGRIGDNRAVASMLGAIKREDEVNEIKMACKWAVEQITGQEVNYAPEATKPTPKTYFIRPIGE